MRPQLLRHTAAVHLDQFRAISMPSVEGSVQGGHRVALASPENSVDSRAVIQKDLARVQVAVQGRDVERRLAIVRSDIQGARSPLRQPLDQLDSTGCDGLVSDPGTTYGSGVKRTAVLTQNLQGLQLALSRGAKRRSEKRRRILLIRNSLLLNRVEVYSKSIKHKLLCNSMPSIIERLEENRGKSLYRRRPIV